MNTTTTLERSDIVNKRIKGVYETPWVQEAGGSASRRTFVELADGITFELQAQGPGILPIERVRLNEVECSPSTEGWFIWCAGRTVREVMVSSRWPGIGLRLYGDFLMYQRSTPNPERKGAVLTGGFSDAVGETHSLDQLTPYWDQT